MLSVPRREFITLLGGAAVAWPLAARGQQPGGRRRLGVLMATTADDPESRKRLFALLQGLQQLGWVEGRNLRVDIRWAAGNADDTRKYAAELIALAPDIILAAGSLAAGPLLQATRTIPIVFTHVPDPVGAGFIDSMARPGGNATGFTSFDYGLSVKWLELLKEIAPQVTRVGVIRDPNFTAGIGQWGAIQGAAPAAGVEVVPVNVRDVAEIERAVAAFARLGNGGLIVTASGLAVVHRDLIIALAARHKLPAVFWQRFFVADGGLISYGDDVIEHYRLAAGYIDRILKGEKPGDLPVQLSTRLELAINLKTAKALGLDMPATVLARADEVIE
jgi:putative ABC transport system substrate-binding protein